MVDRTELFCLKPFEMVDLKKNDAGLCCWIEKSTWENKKSALTVESIWNSPTAEEIRRSILNGSFEFCKSDCPYLEDYGIYSHQPNTGVESIDRFLQVITNAVVEKSKINDPRILQYIENNQTKLDVNPSSVECGFDLSCNLACPSCRNSKIVEPKNNPDIRMVANFCENSLFPTVENLYITGSGDPFGSPFFNNWLRSIDVDEMPNLKNIHLHTNGQLFDQKMWLKIPESTRKFIKTVEVSIDAATPVTYAINRLGGSFERLLKNLEFISMLRASGQLLYLKINMVVQQNNYKQMDDFIKLGKKYNVDCVYFSRLDFWDSFSIESLSSRQIHSPSHPEHGEFIEKLKAIGTNDPKVHLGNFRRLLKGASE